MKTEGYDSPIDTPEQDTLRRLSFAREIAELATSAPKRWPIRIGVYGSWGTGKSSVLQLASGIVSKRGDVSAYFNPWGYSDAEEMLKALAHEAIAAVEAAGQQVEGSAKRKALAKGKSLMGHVKTLWQASEPLHEDWLPAKAVTKAASVGLPWLERILDNQAAKFAALDEALGEKRLVVFIDDVDRVDPGLLPKLLFALHEVMDQPGISYVLALDPYVVTNALKAYHPGFGKDISFLEKIVQFPRWLPNPTPEELAELAIREAAEHAPFIRSEIIRAQLSLLPINPRALRSTLRNLWSYRHEIARHDEDEINGHLLLIVHLLRAEFPSLLHEVITAPEHARKIYRLTHIKADSDFDSNSARRKAVNEYVQTRVKLCHRERAAQLLFALGNDLFWTDEPIKYHALLAERPTPVTGKEFRELVERYREQPQSSTVQAWVSAQVEARDLDAPTVEAGLFATAVKSHNMEMSGAADSRAEESRKEHVARAALVIGLIETLLFEMPGTSQVSPTRFRAVFSAFHSWAHFRNFYESLRNREKGLLVKIVTSNSEPALLLEQLAPWDPTRFHHDPSQKELNEELVRVLTPRVARQLEDIFRQPSAIQVAITSDEVASRWVLFNLQRFWTGTQIAHLQELVAEAPSSAVAENCFWFLRQLTDETIEVGRWGMEKIAAAELLKTSALVTALWLGATASRPNVRHFNNYKELRSSVEKKSQMTLEPPPWWDQLAQDLSHIERRPAADDA